MHSAKQKLISFQKKIFFSVLTRTYFRNGPNAASIAATLIQPCRYPLITSVLAWLPSIAMILSVRRSARTARKPHNRTSAVGTHVDQWAETF